MQTVADIREEHLRAFPDVAFVHIKTDNPETDLTCTLIHNKA